MTFSDLHDPSLHSSTQPMFSSEHTQHSQGPMLFLICYWHLDSLICKLETLPPVPFNHYVHQEDKIRLYCEISWKGVSQYSVRCRRLSQTAFLMKWSWLWAPHSEPCSPLFTCCVTLESYCTSLCLKVFLCNMRTALNTTWVLGRFKELIHIKHLEQFLACNELSEPVSHYCYYCFQRVGSMLCLVTQSCLTLWDPIDCSPTGSSVRGDSPGKNTGMGFHAVFQAIFPTQGLIPGLLHCRQTLYCLSH